MKTYKLITGDYHPHVIIYEEVSNYTIDSEGYTSAIIECATIVGIVGNTVFSTITGVPPIFLDKLDLLMMKEVSHDWRL